MRSAAIGNVLRRSGRRIFYPKILLARATDRTRASCNCTKRMPAAGGEAGVQIDGSDDHGDHKHMAARG
jgi:hypothetical protein